MAVAIITDSACDLTSEEARTLGVEVLPLKVSFSDGDFLDGVDLDARGFFEKLSQTDEFPKTSQVSPAAFQEAFQRALDAGDDVVCITLSSHLSGTFHSAQLACDLINEDNRERVFLIDSHHASVGQQLLLRQAVIFRNNGLKASLIADELEALKKKVHLIALLDTLEYLKKGGRIGAAKALVGKVLSIKPVICVEKGKAKLLGQARGSKKGFSLMKELAKKNGEPDLSKPYRLAYSGLSTATLSRYWKEYSGFYMDEDAEPPATCIGPVIGSHIGPGAIGIAYFSK